MTVAKSIRCFCTVMVVTVMSFFASSVTSPAYAQCVAGQPCTTPPTADQLEFPTTNPNPNNQDKTTSPMCDANFMNQIYAKAFLEAEREVVISNSVMLKPDSVLEYTCYDQLAAYVATEGGPIFSESDRWHPTTVPNPNSTPISIDVYMGDTLLDSQIEALVLDSLNAYANGRGGGSGDIGSFSYDFLGGTAAGDNNTFSTTVSGVGGVCDFMYAMYHIAKCDDFALNSGGFMTFEEIALPGGGGLVSPALVSTDPRLLPMTCPSNHAITQAIVDVAKNQDWTYAWIDQVDTLLPIMNPPDPSACENSDPVPTGVMVQYVQYGQDINNNPIVSVAPYTYPDKVCTNPGCYFNNNNNADGSDDTCVAIP